MENKKIKVLGTLSMLELCVEHSLSPIINIDRIDEIHIVRTTPGPLLNKVIYHCPPKIFRFLSPINLLSKLLLLIYLGIRLQPDIIISSKALTAGFFPMGAVILKQEMADEFVQVSEEAEEFPHGFTSGGHPVGCAIALKAIDVIINEGLLDNVKNVSPYFLNRLKEFDEYEHIGETRGIGLMAALEIVKDKSSKIPFDPDMLVGDKVANQSIDNGLICRPLGPAIVLCPPFIITKEQIDTMFNMLHDTLKSVFNNLD